MLLLAALVVRELLKALPGRADQVIYEGENLLPARFRLGYHHEYPVERKEHAQCKRNQEFDVIAG